MKIIDKFFSKLEKIQDFEQVGFSNKVRGIPIRDITLVIPLDGHEIVYP